MTASLLHSLSSIPRPLRNGPRPPNSTDKIFEQALSFIATQCNYQVREAAADVFGVAVIFIADAICICIQEMGRVETIVRDQTHLEDAKERVSQGVVQSVSALKGIYGLMSDDTSPPASTTPTVVEQIRATEGGKAKQRSQSLDMGAGRWVRRLSATLSPSSAASTVSGNVNASATANYARHEGAGNGASTHTTS